MREILFRGKRIDSGEWVYGTMYKIAIDLNPFIITLGKLGCSYQVDEETVGQYTGFVDKNGKRIFDGDILRSRYDDLYPYDESIEVVKWFRNGWNIQQAEYPPDAMDEYGVMPYSEVIGNITDNPELLEK